eukprot:1151742-Pelagomonas_calceolata.AAC.3
MPQLRAIAEHLLQTSIGNEGVPPYGHKQCCTCKSQVHANSRHISCTRKLQVYIMYTHTPGEPGMRGHHCCLQGAAQARDIRTHA